MPAGSTKGFTLLELLVVTVIIAVLSGLTFAGLDVYRGLATRAVCSSNLRQLGAAVNLYTSDSSGFFPSYVKSNPGGGKMWYFGLETSKPGASEGNRDLDVTSGPLYPYIQEVGKIEVCPGFNYSSALWKAKFKGSSYGYGYNWLLGGRLGGTPVNVATLSSGGRVILFGDCGQVNTFQAPATPKKPMVEEFYIINETDKTIHFRHGGRANILFVDGHVESMKPHPGTTDKRVRGEILGRVTKTGSAEMLK